MHQTGTSSGYECDDAGVSIHAGLLITPTSSDRYKRLWQRGICVGLFITLKKSSSRSYAPLPSAPTGEQLSRTSSSRSEVRIDVRSDSEEKEEERGGDDPVGEQQLLWNSVVRIVKEKDLNALRSFGGAERVVSVFGSQLEIGHNGGHDPQAWNPTNPVQTKGLFHFFLKACNSYTIFLLLISAGLSLVTEILEEGPKYGWHDGATILLAVFLLVTFPSVANFCRARKLEKKMLMRENRPEVEIIKNGESQLVHISNIVERDIVCLKKGDQIPADGLFVAGAGLVLDEVLDSNINRDQNPFLFSGSKVIEGNGHMIVTSLSTNTAMGKVMPMVEDDPNEPTLLQTRIEKPNNYADKIALCMSILIILVMFLRFLWRNHDDDNGQSELKGKVPMKEVMRIFEKILLKPQGLVSILTTSLTAVVLGFHHGMPLVITFSLSYWNEKVVSDHVNPQNLSACGTMGITTVFCINVSGGLMCTPMEVGKFLIGEKEIKQETEISQVVLGALQQGIGVSVLLPKNLRSPTDDLLNSWVQSKWGVNMDLLKESSAIVDSRNLSFNKKCSGVLLMRKSADDEKIMHLHWKGSAETILGMCSHYYDCGGKNHVLENQKSKFEQVIKDMEESGLRPIAFAYKQTEVQEIKEDGLILLALLGLKYTKETKSAVEALKNAGVSIKLVSGDELWKAKAIASELGIFRPGSNDVALEGEQFRTLDPNARRDMMDQITVMGRSHPNDKFLMVQCLKDEGHVVAFYGVLTAGDSRASKEADVGITKENLSTAMARESSDILLTSGGGLCSITPLLNCGRCVYHNIQKFIQLQLTACMSGLLITAIATIRSGESPITAIQLIWVNFIICILGGMMMLMEPPAQALMTQPPEAKRTKSLMTRVMWTNSVIQVLCQASVLLIFQFEGQAIPGINKEVTKSMIFNSFTLCQVFNQFNAMELEKKEVFVVVIQYHWFLVVLGVVMVMQVLVVEFATSLASYVRLNWVQWAFCFLFAALSWGFNRALTFILVFLSNWSIGSISSHIGFSTRANSTYLLCMGCISSMFLFFSYSYYFNLGIARTFR